MVLPIVPVILALAVLAVVIFGLTDWFEIMFLGAIALGMMAMYKNVI